MLATAFGSDVKRFRSRFALVALAVAIPLVLLLVWSLRSVAEEDRFRTHALASRIFDEMEAELTSVLERDFSPETPSSFSGWSGSRAEPTRDHAFIVGYFEVEQNGSVSTTPDPRYRDAAGREQLESLAANVWQAPSTAGPLPGPEPEQEAQNVYTQLSKLNRSADKRSEVLQRQQANANIDSAPTASSVTTANSPTAASSPERGSRFTRQPEVGGLSSRIADKDHLLVFRTVREGTNARRSGLVIDVNALTEHLTQKIIVPNDLAPYATLRPLDAAENASGRQGGEWIHRFAEPFGQLVLSLRLSGLPQSGSAGYVYSLSVLVVLAAVLGMLAVYRMVNTSLTFAERRSNFVSAVTHELKTPLTAIRMYSEMLQEDLVADQPTRERYYRTITAETERLTRLVNNVLELSALERNQRTMSLMVGDVAPVLQEVAEVVRPHVAEQGFELELQLEHPMPAVRFERDALVQVLVNLVDNAIKYARNADNKTIQLLARSHQDGGVVVSVADYGPGVEDKHLRHIFEPFYRGQQELTRTAKGAGIGLSLVRSLVERMHGSVTGRNTTPGFLVEIHLSAS